jgi:hypothetical protein
LYEAGEHPTLSQPAQVDVAALFKGVAILSMEEATLSGDPIASLRNSLGILVSMIPQPHLCRQQPPLPHFPHALVARACTERTAAPSFAALFFLRLLQLKQLDGTVVTMQPNTFRTFRVTLKSV